MGCSVAGTLERLLPPKPLYRITEMGILEILGEMGILGRGGWRPHKQPIL